MIMQRDENDMVELVTSCQNEFKEYYIQMQAAKRSQAPHPSQVVWETTEKWNCILIYWDLSSNHRNLNCLFAFTSSKWGLDKAIELKLI